MTLSTVLANTLIIVGTAHCIVSIFKSTFQSVASKAETWRIIISADFAVLEGGLTTQATRSLIPA